MPRSTAVTTSTVYENKKKRAQEIYKKVVEIRVNEGLSYSAIARKLEITKTSVYRHLAWWKKGVPVEGIKPNCRPQKVTPQLRQTLGQLVARSDVPTSNTLAKTISAKTGTPITSRTVCRHLSNYMGYQSSVPRAVPLLTSLQQQKRVEWCLQHRDFNWDNVWFSDETYIEVNYKCTPVWHKSGKRPTFQKPKFSAKIMCWGAVSTRLKSKLAVVEGTMTSFRYVDTLKTYLVGKKSESDINKMIFQQDNASCHTAKHTRAFFSEVGLTVLPWPANSPDLNPIENIWSVLKQRVEKHAVKTKDDLIRVVKAEWSSLDMDLIRRTIYSMKNRIEQVHSRGGLKCDY
jgi:transposase